MASELRVIDRGWRDIVNNINALNDAVVKVGFPTGGEVAARTRRGSGHEPYENIPDVATIAFWNEFGTSRMDERPFMRNAFQKAFPRLIRLRNRLYGKVVDGRMSAEEAMGTLGELLVAQTRREIRALRTPENAQSTVNRKGSSNPLIDTGQMIQSVQQQVQLGAGRPLRPGIQVN